MNKRNKIYGLGSSQAMFYGSGKSHNNACNSSYCSNQDHQNMEAELKEMKDLVKAMQEEHHHRLKVMEIQLSMMFEARNSQSPNSPEIDLDSHNSDNA